MSFYRKYGKRVFDLCLTVPAFVVLSPVMLVTAGLVAVKLEGRYYLHRNVPAIKKKYFECISFEP